MDGPVEVSSSSLCYLTDLFLRLCYLSDWFIISTGCLSSLTLIAAIMWFWIKIKDAQEAVLLLASAYSKPIKSEFQSRQRSLITLTIFPLDAAAKNSLSDKKIFNWDTSNRNKYLFSAKNSECYSMIQFHHVNLSIPFRFF